jgi:hypothetical protein
LFDAVDRLEDPGVDALRQVPGQGAFGGDQRLEADEGQSQRHPVPSAEMSPGRASGPDPTRLVFVDVHAHMEFGEVAEEDQWGGLRHGGNRFAGTHVDAEDGSRNGGMDGASGQFGLGGLEAGVGGGNLGPRFVDPCGCGADREAPADDLLLGADPVRLETFGAGGLVLEIFERGPGGFDACFGRPPLGAAQFHLGLERSIIEPEERRSGGDGVPNADQHLGDDAGLGGANGNEFRTRFHQADGGHGVGDSRPGRCEPGFHQRVVGLSPNNGNGGQRDHGERDEG